MHPLLSARQEQCLRLTAFRTDKEIAAHLGISEATVKKHVHEACQRLKVNRRKAALALLDPIVPDQGGKSPLRATGGYPKHPMARAASVGQVPLENNPGGDGRNNDDSDGRSGTGSVTGAEPDRTGARLGYRSPPDSPILRIVLVVVVTLILAALVVTVVVMLGDMHEAVGRIDAAATNG